MTEPAPGPTAPPHVGIIISDTLRIDATTRELRQSIVATGRRSKRTVYGFEVAFEPGGAHLENDDLVELLQDLA